MLSSFTLISLVGVMLGVLVLVVVMSVYAGLEREVKGKILGFTPHVLMQAPADATGRSTLGDWPRARELALRIPHVKSATPFISDHLFLDYMGMRQPIGFSAVDTSDPEQVKGLDAMLDKEKFPGSSADLGIDDRLVISSNVANQFGLQVGDTVRLYSMQNMKEAADVAQTTENPPLREYHADAWREAATVLASAWKPAGASFEISQADYRAVYGPLLGIFETDTKLRPVEKNLVEEILTAFDSGPEDEARKVFTYTAAQKDAIMAAWKSLENPDTEKMDGEILKGIRRFILPKEALVSGIYQTTMMAAMPDLFVPLPLAQSLAGLDEGVVQGVALRLTDPYLAEESAGFARRDLGEQFLFVTWGDQFASFFTLINQQRMMMYFALSFIVLVSAFSMMAVMFTVTILKRREIGVMKAVGAAPGQIVRVFLYQGMLLGITGAILGVLLGRLVIHFRGPIQAVFRAMGFDPFSSAIMGSNVMPAHNNPAEQVIIGLLAFVFCSAAALIPAFFAARSDAAKSLRNL